MLAFVSSPIRGMEQARAAARAAIESLGWPAFLSEGEGSSPASSLDHCLSKVREAELFVLLLGSRYGYKPPGRRFSFTHLEYLEARKRKKRVLAYKLDYFDHEPEQNHFIAQVEHVTRGVFLSVVSTASALRENLLRDIPTIIPLLTRDAQREQRRRPRAIRLPTEYEYVVLRAVGHQLDASGNALRIMRRVLTNLGRQPTNGIINGEASDRPMRFEDLRLAAWSGEGGILRVHKIWDCPAYKRWHSHFHREVGRGEQYDFFECYRTVDAGQFGVRLLRPARRLEIAYKFLGDPLARGRRLTAQVVSHSFEGDVTHKLGIVRSQGLMEIRYAQKGAPAGMQWTLSW